MSLPKIDSPVFDTVLPFTGTRVQFRPFKVKEEKILLIAQQSGEPKQIYDAVIQVIVNCIVNDVDINTLPAGEVDLLFVKMRAISVNNVVQLRMLDEEASDKSIEIELDLDEVTVQFDKSKIKNEIVLDAKYKAKLQMPTFGMSRAINEASNGIDLSIDAMCLCIESIFTPDGSEVFYLKDYSFEERKEWLESLDRKALKDLNEYMSSLPVLEHDIKYTTTTGEEKTRKLRGLTDFFSFA